MNEILHKRIEEAAFQESSMYDTIQEKNAAYSTGMKIATFALQNQWISVKDELPKPPKGEDILVIARSDDSIYIASYADDGWIIDFEGKSIKCNFIKYWMPIPELTKK